MNEAHVQSEEDTAYLMFEQYRQDCEDAQFGQDRANW
jgi:hypothetical protein